jgi:hypothetical protein
VITAGRLQADFQKEEPKDNGEAATAMPVIDWIRKCEPEEGPAVEVGKLEGIIVGEMAVERTN